MQAGVRKPVQFALLFLGKPQQLITLGCLQEPGDDVQLSWWITIRGDAAAAVAEASLPSAATRRVGCHRSAFDVTS